MPRSKKNRPLPQTSVVARIATLICTHNLLKRGDKVVVAVSGGADSLALLHILHAIDLQLQLLATYVDHGLRPLETPHEQTTIKQFCQSLGVAYTAQAVDVQRLAKEEGLSTEEAARILRYKTLEQVRDQAGAQAIAVGHTADDQVEEFFIRLIRGTGLTGLSGMKLLKNHIVRPLLLEKKETLIEYLSSLDITWCLDSSNLDTHFLRNRIRIQLLPNLEKDFNPAIRRTVMQTMTVLAEEEAYLATETAKVFSRCVTETQVAEHHAKKALVVDGKITDFHPAMSRRVIEQCLIQMAIRPSFHHITMLLQFLGKGTKYGEIHLDCGVRAEKNGTQLVLCRPLPEGKHRGTRNLLPGISLAIPQPGTYPVQSHNKVLVVEETRKSSYQWTDTDRLLLDREKINFPLLLRNHLPGERFHPFNSPGSKKVSRFFNDRKIPAKERSSWPVLVAEDTIVAIPGIQLDHHYRITEATTIVLTISWRDLGNKRP